MSFGIVIWSIGFVVFLFMLLFESVKDLKSLIQHWGFRIVADIAVESEFLEKKMEQIVDRVVRRVLSDTLIKHLDERDKKKKQ